MDTNKHDSGTHSQYPYTVFRSSVVVVVVVVVDSTTVPTSKEHEQMTTASSSSSTTTTTTWKEALYRMCHAKQCLTGTPQQVLEYHHHNTTTTTTEDDNSSIAAVVGTLQRPSVDDCILLLPSNSVETTAKSIVSQIRMHTTTTTTTTWNTTTASVATSIQQMVGTVSWTLSKLVDRVLLWNNDTDHDEDYNQEELTWMEPNDDYVLNDTTTGTKKDSTETTTRSLVDWDQPVVCVEWIQECVTQLVLSAATTSHGELLALHRYGRKPYSLATWIGTTTQMSYSMSDLDLMAHVLVESGHAVFYQDYIVIGSSGNNNNTTTSTEQSTVEVAVTLVQLKQALEDIEQQLEEWTRRIEECTLCARDKKKRKNVKGALYELQKRTRLQQKVQHARTMYLNLLQVHDTLETAYLQQSHTIAALQATTRALQGLRQEYDYRSSQDGRRHSGGIRP